MSAFIDLTGQKFARLSVIKRAPNRGNKTFWECLCDCGKGITTVPWHLRNGNTRSCGCLQREAAARNGHGKASPETPKKTLFAKYKVAARRRNLPFELSYENFIWLISQDCCYCGSSPSTIEVHVLFPFTFNGIDRWDNAIGYTKENSVTCCKTCNFLKMKLLGDDFIDHCKKIATHRWEIA